jgi:hypothetical protein
LYSVLWVWLLVLGLALALPMFFSMPVVWARRVAHHRRHNTMPARTSGVAGCTVGREPHYTKYRGRLLYKTAAAQYNAGAKAAQYNAGAKAGKKVRTNFFRVWGDIFTIVLARRTF